REGVHKGAVVLAITPLQLQVRLAGGGPYRALVPCEGLGVAGGDGDVADQVDAGRAAGQVLAALGDAVVGGHVTGVHGAVHLGRAGGLGVVVRLLGQHALDGDLGGFEVHRHGDRADDVRGVNQQRG